MRRLLFPLAIVGCLAAQPVLAEGVKQGAPGTNVDMPYLIAPMSQDGKLLGYTYIASRMVAVSPSAAMKVREKLAFIQDAFVRSVNSRSTGKRDDPTAVDTDLLNARLLADAKRIVGNDKIVGLIFTQVIFTPLRPPASPESAAPAAEAGQGAGESAAASASNQDSQTAAPATSDATASATSQPAPSAPN